MKTSVTPFRLALLAAAFILCRSSFVSAQGGSLTPPGAPAVLFKTLQEVEPRTPISSAPFTISASGSYYLTGNLAVTTGNAITISADNVTLDLNGFSISSTHATGSGNGVLINSTRKNITVKNGHIRGTTTFAAGVFTPGGFIIGVSNISILSANLRISDLNIQGMVSVGIDLGTTAERTFVVERCNVDVCADLGLRAGVLRDCTAATTGNHAIFAEIASHCSGETVNTAAAGAAGVFGIVTVENCTGVSASGAGISGNTVSNSVGTSTSGTGLVVGDSAINCKGISTSGSGLSAVNNATNCTGTSTSGTGLSAINATNCTGTSTSGPAGIFSSSGSVTFSRGRRDGGTAISATNAIGCTVTGTGTVTATNKSLGTP